jgi:hypothetical protein
MGFSPDSASVRSLGQLQLAALHQWRSELFGLGLTPASIEYFQIGFHWSGRWCGHVAFPGQPDTCGEMLGFPVRRAGRNGDAMRVSRPLYGHVANLKEALSAAVLVVPHPVIVWRLWQLGMVRVVSFTTSPGKWAMQWRRGALRRINIALVTSDDLPGQRLISEVVKSQAGTVTVAQYRRGAGIEAILDTCLLV